jgi:trehalose 6-phosphate phosphatase
MIPLLSESGLSILMRLLLTKPLLGFDFDGTLVPLEEDPQAVCLPVETKLLLQKLSSIYSVAVISGRSLSDVSNRVGIESVRYVGNHGAEGGGTPSQIQEESRAWVRTWIRQWDEQVLKFAIDPSVRLEDKGLSLSVHYRQAVKSEEQRVKIYQLLKGLSPTPRIGRGHEVWNLVHPAAPHKGHALLTLMQEFPTETALYFGDDQTDEDVFSLGLPQIVGVRIGQADASSALLALDSPSAVVQVMKIILSLS